MGGNVFNDDNTVACIWSYSKSHFWDIQWLEQLLVSLGQQGILSGDGMDTGHVGQALQLYLDSGAVEQCMQRVSW